MALVVLLTVFISAFLPYSRPIDWDLSTNFDKMRNKYKEKKIYFFEHCGEKKILRGTDNDINIAFLNGKPGTTVPVKGECILHIKLGGVDKRSKQLIYTISKTYRHVRNNFVNAYFEVFVKKSSQAEWKRELQWTSTAEKKVYHGPNLIELQIRYQNKDPRNIKYFELDIKIESISRTRDVMKWLRITVAAIIGILIGVVILIIILVVCVWCFCCRKKTQPGTITGNPPYGMTPNSPYGNTPYGMTPNSPYGNTPYGMTPNSPYGNTPYGMTPNSPSVNTPNGMTPNSPSVKTPNAVSSNSSYSNRSASDNK